MTENELLHMDKKDIVESFNDSNTPLLSIIVPVCNVEKYLAQCMESIIGQKVHDIEVICINDGSTDSSLSILKKYADADSRIHIIDKANAGYGAAMNDGLDAAHGKYLTILESDDFTTKDGWAKLIDICEKHDLDIGKGCYYRHSDTDEFFRVYEQTDVHCPPWIAKIPTNVVFDPKDAIRIFWMTPSIWSCVYRRSYLEASKARFNETPGASFQDTGFFFEIWATAKRAMIIDDPILHYRIDNSGSSSKSTKKVHTVREEADFIKDFLQKNNIEMLFKQVLCSIRYKTYLWNAKRIADEYIPEFKEGADSDLLQDFRDGFFSPLLFNKKDCEDFLSRVKESVSSESEALKLEYSSSPLVSVIVKPSNNAITLEKLLGSIATQKYPKIEVICMLDGQNSNCIDTFSRFSEKDKRFNKFVFGTLDQSTYRDAMLLAHGKYILLCDAYESFRPMSIRRLAGAAYTNDLNMVLFKKGRNSNVSTETKAGTRPVVAVGADAKELASTLLTNEGYGIVFEKAMLKVEDLLHALTAIAYRPAEDFDSIEFPLCLTRAMIAKCKYPFTEKIKSTNKTGNTSKKKQEHKKGFIKKISDLFR